MNAKLSIRNSEALILEGAIPQRRTENVNQALRVQSASQPVCGHYYLRMPKQDACGHYYLRRHGRFQ